jgi:hypothetical protein
MPRKVKLAVFDNDLKAEIKKYPISDSGNHILVVKGGESHFMPRFDNDSFLEIPKKFLRWNRGYERLYFAKKGAKKCVNFKTEETFGPNPEELKKAISSTLLTKIGKPEANFPAWLIYLILLIVIGIALKVFEVIP